MTANTTTVLPDARALLTDHEQMLDAQNGCVPCKLCGGNAIITDAGTGAGYYIRCRKSVSFRDSKGCMLNERRLGGWAYNVMDWWNRLHATPPASDAAVPAVEAVEFAARILWADGQRRLKQGQSDLPRTRTDFRDAARALFDHPALTAAPKVASDTGAGERFTQPLVSRDGDTVYVSFDAPDDEIQPFILDIEHATAFRDQLVAALATDATDGATGGGEVRKPYLSDRFKWAAPGDQQEDAWIVRFCDNDVRDALYTGPEAEDEARAAWERHAPGYNMYLFRLARLATTTGADLLEQAARKFADEWNEDPDSEKTCEARNAVVRALSARNQTDTTKDTDDGE